MENLKSANVQLKTIRLTEYAELIKDLNYNFSQILSLPGFKGKPGDVGESVVGETGQRGSIWVFATTARFRATYPSITTASQINLAFINSELLSNQSRLYSALGFGDDETLIDNDVVVLPSGQVIQLQVNIPNTAPHFVDAGITFSQVASLTEDRVRKIITETVGGPSDDVSVLKLYNAIAKNVSDDTPGGNIEINQDSVADIETSAAGPGPAIQDTKFLGLKETYASELTKICLIAGSAESYHKLIQKTQTILNNDYAPGVDDFASFVVLQNSYKNGVLIGHREADSIRKFARLYRTANSFVISSSYSPAASEYSEVVLKDSEILLRATNKVTVDADTLDLRSVKSILGSRFNIDDSTKEVTIGNKQSTKKIILQTSSGTSDGIFLDVDVLKSVNLLSTDTDGKLIQAFTVATNIADTIAALSDTKLPTERAVGMYLYSHDMSIADIYHRLSTLEGSDTSGIFQKRQLVTTGSFDSFTEFGTFELQWNATSGNFQKAPFPVNNTANSKETCILNVFSSNGGLSIVQTAIKHNIGNNSSTVSTATRIGKRANLNSQLTWGSWVKLVDSENVSSVIKAGNGLLISGSETNTQDPATFETGLHIHHRDTVAAGSNISLSAGTGEAITAVSTDRHGHITNIKKSKVSTAADIEAAIKAALPQGVITMWSGQITNIPSGWRLCDGTGGTPDLRARFVVGASSESASTSDMHNGTGYRTHAKGGLAHVTLTTSQIPKHSHSIRGDYFKKSGSGSSLITGLGANSEGLGTSYRNTELNTNGGQSHENRPPYYALAYIMKVY